MISYLISHLHALWNDLWPNTVAPSAWTLAAVVISHLRAARQRERHHAGQMRTAAAAHQIAADLYAHHTGQQHPAAPSTEGEGK